MKDWSEEQTSAIQRALDQGANALEGLWETCLDYLRLVSRRELTMDLQSKAGDSDLIQESLMEAHRDFVQFQGRTAQDFLAWLREIHLHNLANFRRRFRESQKRDVSKEVPLGTDRAGQQDVAAEGTSPSQKAIRNEEEEAIERALNDLPDRYRRVIIWRQRERCDFKEIGIRLNCSPEAARKLWVRGIERLSDRLGHLDES